MSIYKKIQIVLTQYDWTGWLMQPKENLLIIYTKTKKIIIYDLKNVIGESNG